MSKLQRLVVVMCPTLSQNDDSGRATRAFNDAMDCLAEFTPHVEVIRQGICAMPARGPSRYFGGEQALAHAMARAVDAAIGEPAQVGVADGLFAAFMAAHHAQARPTVVPVIVPSQSTPAFLANLPVSSLGRPDLTDLLSRLGISNLGAFASLPTRHVLARLGTEAAACHRVARCVEGELDGLRAKWQPPPSSSDRSAHDDNAQRGFWGQSSAAEQRARDAICRAQEILHSQALVIGHLGDGRGPSERARLVPWPPKTTSIPQRAPWPGQVPPPSPVYVFAPPKRAQVQDDRAMTLSVKGNGLLDSPPARLSVEQGPWQPVTAWAGPWPFEESWWSPRRRRKARMQVVTGGGLAHLLVCESSKWWVEGTYD